MAIGITAIIGMTIVSLASIAMANQARQAARKADQRQDQRQRPRNAEADLERLANGKQVRR